MKKIVIKKLPKIPFTPKGYQNLLAQKKQLMADRSPAVENLRKARELGDLSENAYYKAARAKLSFIDLRLRKLDHLTRQAFMVEPVKKDEIGIGSQVEISDGQEKHQYDLVGSYESNPLQGTISHLSPLGKALMGRKEKDVVEVQTPGGIKKYTILKVNLPS